MQTIVRPRKREAFCFDGKEQGIRRRRVLWKENLGEEKEQRFDGSPNHQHNRPERVAAFGSGTVAVHSFVPGQSPMVHVSVASPAGAYTVGNASFFRYIVRLAEAGVRVHGEEREALELLSAIPHAFFDDEEWGWGRGWRIVPPASMDDWPVLESTPQRIRAAFEVARRILWENAAPVGVTADEIVEIEDELDAVYSVLERAERAGVPVNISYVS